MALTEMIHDRGATAKRIAAARAAIDVFEVPPPAWHSCPWEPRQLVEQGFRQWLRCASVAMFDRQIVGMPSRAVDELWHGVIVETEAYSRLCSAAFGRMLHHQPEGDAEAADPLLKTRLTLPFQSVQAQLGRTVVAWELVADPGETCVLWDLDRRLGLDHPWGVAPDFVARVRGELDGGRQEPPGIPRGLALASAR